MESFCNINKIYLSPISKNIARQMIVKNHYSHKWTLCQVAYGIFIRTEDNSKFLNENETKLIGCIIYAQPVGRSAAQSLSDILKINEVFELTRLWIEDGHGKNIESYCISLSFKHLNRDFPEIKAVISYADGEQGHKGTIYQACNFLYQGNSSIALMPNYSISLSKDPYKWIHSRTVSSKYGSHNVEHLKLTINKTFWRKKESSKHRYIIFIGNKSENKRLKKSLKHPILEYPKSSNFISEIEEITVDSKENCFF